MMVMGGAGLRPALLHASKTTGVSIMTRRPVLLLALLVAGLAVLVGGASPSLADSGRADRVLFRDDFSKANTGSWTFYNRLGRIESGRLWIDGGYVPNAVGRDGWAYTHVGESAWKDYAFDATYNVEGSPDRQIARLYVRVASDSTTTGPPGTAYIVEIWDPGNPSEGGVCAGYGAPLPNGSVKLLKFVNGVGEFLTEVCSSNTVHGENAAHVQVKGNAIDVSVNGKALLHYEDAAPIRSGGIGVGQIWETNGSYDNVVVTDLTKRDDHGDDQQGNKDDDHGDDQHGNKNDDRDSGHPSGIEKVKVTLVSPGRDAVIAQNVSTIGCTPNATTGYGFSIKFAWKTNHDKVIAGYELLAQHQGSPIPIVSVTLNGADATSFTYRSCNAFVMDSNLNSWEWSVRAVDDQGQKGAWTAGNFSFARCRLANGTQCYAPAP
jgi:hypothetical protein